MQSTRHSKDDTEQEAQIFVLRVPQGADATEVEHVNAGTLTHHATLQEAFGRITELVEPDTSRTRRH